MALPHSGASDAGNALSPSGVSAYDNSNSHSGQSSGRNLGSLQNFAEKKMTRDGQPQKKRGPKPDAKPAATRRQQLNRQAQRSHRERKELHMHELELQVIRDKQIHLATLEEKRAVEDENRLLRQILDRHGIFYPTKNQQHNFVDSGPSVSTDQGSHSFNFCQSPTTSLSAITQSSMPEPASFRPDLDLEALEIQESLDYNEIELTFILKLEGCCHDHASGICVPGQYNPKASLSGHTLMASYGNVEDRNILRANLTNLLDLSLKLPLEGEITPIMAWMIITTHERFNELTLADFELLGDDLRRVTRCYGFGAALEDFEVRDALNNVFATKVETFAAFT